MDTSSPTDEALATIAQHGGSEAAGQLFDRYWPAAWRAAVALTGSREAAEDVVQDAFESAFRSISRYDPTRPFGAWLHRIVVNRALNHLRSERRRKALSESPETEVPAETTSAGEGGAALLAVVSHLAPERRVVIVLRYGLDYTLAEIADLLEVPVGTVQSRIHRALVELRPQFEVTR